MAGTGVQLFLSGQILTASDVNTYLMDQVISRFDTPEDRDAAFGSGLPISQPGGDGKPALSEGRFCYLVSNTNDGEGTPTVQYYNGNAWVDAETFVPEDNSIGPEKLTTAVAGNGLAGGDGSALSVNVDDSTIEINSDSLRIKDAGVTASKIATAVAGNGLSGGGGSALAINVDDSTIEISSDSLRLKDAGITSAKLGANISLTGTTEIEEVLEAVVVNATALTGTVNIDAKSGAVHFFTSNSTANWVWNFRGDGSTTLNSMMDVGQSITFALFATNGGTAYRPTSLTVDTTGTVTVKWFGGNSYPSGNASSVDCYTVTVIKTAANTYTAFASQSKFA